MWQLVFTYISVKGWVTHSDEDGFFDGSCQIVVFSAHNDYIHLTNNIGYNICQHTQGF